MIDLPRRTWSPEVHAGLCAMLDDPPGDTPPQAVFDWDDTLLGGDCSLAYMRRHDRLHGTTWFDDYFALLAAEGRDAAYPIIARWLAGGTVEDVAAFMEACADEALGSGALAPRPEMLDLVHAMRARGWDVWIVTASPTALVYAYAHRFGFAHDHVLGMALEVEDGRYVDRLIPPLTYCQGKADAIALHLPHTPAFVTGDSRSDADMLGIAHRALLLDGHDVDLRTEAQARGWWLQPGWHHTPAEPGVRTEEAP